MTSDKPKPAAPTARLDIHLGDNLEVLRALPDGCFSLIYIDPPFNTGRVQRRWEISATSTSASSHESDATEAGPSEPAATRRPGYANRGYRLVKLGSREYADIFDDYLLFLEPRLEEARRLLSPTGSLFLHLDSREVHYAKVMLDMLFGRDCFRNEIIWAWDYGARTRKRWPAKHDNILWYSRDPKRWTFDLDACDRIPYMAPKLVGPEKTAAGKTPTDCWWHTIVGPQAKEKTGYPNQKPRGILERIVKVHSAPGERLCDFFAGSGSFGEAAVRNGRDCVLVDSNPEAMAVMEKRFAGERMPEVHVEWHGASVSAETATPAGPLPR
jgi:site-specific DNA-methyltransferase (adenine-specific)